jgi:hypothetical protein
MFQFYGFDDMPSSKFDLPLLDYTTRFTLWQVKMWVVLAHPDQDDALDRFSKKDYKTRINEDNQKRS